MKYYLISEQDVYDISIELENLILAILERKEVEECPDEGEEWDPRSTKIDSESIDY